MVLLALLAVTLPDHSLARPAHARSKYSAKAPVAKTPEFCEDDKVCYTPSAQFADANEMKAAMAKLIDQINQSPTALRITDCARANALAGIEHEFSNIRNRDYVSIVDYTHCSDEPRMTVFDLKNSSWMQIKVAHGIGSDRKRTGCPTKFGNPSAGSTFVSSLGVYLTDNKYKGPPKDRTLGGPTDVLRMVGRQTCNSNACSRKIYMHSSPAKVLIRHGHLENNYMTNSWFDHHAGKPGHTDGCFGISRDNWVNKSSDVGLREKLANGSLLYAHYEPLMCAQAVGHAREKCDWVETLELAPTAANSKTQPANSTAPSPANASTSEVSEPPSLVHCPKPVETL